MASGAESPDTPGRKARFVDAITAAGHVGAVQSADGELFIKPSTRQEADFYETLIQSHPGLMQVVPEFMGILTEQQVDADGAGAPNVDVDALVREAEERQDVASLQRIAKPGRQVAIVLGNLMHGFVEPCVLDVKLGSKLWDESASPEKRARMEHVSATTTSGSLGFRVAGMSVYDPSTGERRAYGKEFGRAHKPETVVRGFGEFFASIPGKSPGMAAEKRQALVDQIVAELRTIYDLLIAEETRMVSSSILVVYEGDTKAFDEKLERGNAMYDEAAARSQSGESEDSDEDGEDYPTILTVKLIDFAHSKFVPGDGPDELVLRGLKNLISTFEALDVELLKDPAKADAPTEPKEQSAHTTSETSK